jgi:hypothetical protein
MTEKIKPKFEFNKIDEDHYAFVMRSDDIERTEIVSKQFAKDHYKEIKDQKVDLMKNLATANKLIERGEMVKDAEMDKFLEMANKAAEYKKAVEALESRLAILDMIEKITQSMESIEQKIPEVKRMSEQ